MVFGGSSPFLPLESFQTTHCLAQLDWLVVQGMYQRGSTGKVRSPPPNPVHISASCSSLLVFTPKRERSMAVVDMPIPTLAQCCFMIGCISRYRASRSPPRVEARNLRMIGWLSGPTRIPLASFLGNALSRYSLALSTLYSVY